MASVALGQLGQVTIRQIDNICRKVALDLFKSCIYRSPVGNPDLWQHAAPAGYIGGRFRGNWQLGVGSSPSGELDRIDESGAATYEDGKSNVPTTGAGGNVYYIVNNLPYAKRLDEGWSSQAPAGIVGLAIAEFDGMILRAQM